VAIVRSLTKALLAAAAEAGVDRKEVAKRATELLHEDFPDAGKVARKTVASHLAKLEEQGTTEDLPRSGRPPALNDTQLDLAIRHFLGGYYVEGEKPTDSKQWFGFTSIAQAMLHACPNSDKLRTMWLQSGLELRGFWDAMCRRKGPRGFNEIWIEYHKGMDKDTKKERVDKCKVWANMPTEELESIVFMDEKPLWLCGAYTFRCYAPDGMQDIEREGQLLTRDNWKLKWLSAVNAKLGGIYFEQISGSMGFETPYMVRT
jgi:hypothetical protein